jgi:hypothetical protein
VAPGASVFTAELNYFINHQDELVAKHRGKTLVLKDGGLVGAYDTPMQAYAAALERHFAVGSFMLQPCQPGTAAYTVTISTATW